MVRAKLALPGNTPLVTPTVKEYEPAAVGVPEMTPPLESVRPLGRAPAVMDQVRGGGELTPIRVTEYAAPTVPCGSGEVVRMEIPGI